MRPPGGARGSRRVVNLGAGGSGQPREPLLEGSGAKNRAGATWDGAPPLQRARNRILRGLTERQLQALVRGALERAGFVVWVVPNMRLTTAGLPDLVFWHPDMTGRLFAWELKTETGRPTPNQRAAIDHLSTVPGIDARIVRPSQWEALRDDLIRRALEG